MHIACRRMTSARCRNSSAVALWNAQDARTAWQEILEQNCLPPVTSIQTRSDGFLRRSRFCAAVTLRRCCLLPDHFEWAAIRPHSRSTVR
jgi:hypothetical protein